MFVIKPECVSEVLDRLCGLVGEGFAHKSNYVCETDMYEFFDRNLMDVMEIKELERHRT